MSRQGAAQGDASIPRPSVKAVQKGAALQFGTTKPWLQVEAFKTVQEGGHAQLPHGWWSEGQKRRLLELCGVCL